MRAWRQCSTALTIFKFPNKGIVRHIHTCASSCSDTLPLLTCSLFISVRPRKSRANNLQSPVGLAGRTCDCCSDHRPLTGPTVAAAGSATPQLVARRLPWLVRVHILRHRAHDACMRQPYPESDCPAHPEGEDADPDSVVPPARTGRCEEPLSRDQNKGSDQATPFR